MPAAYLNPVEALNLGGIPPDEIDAAAIRRAKKGLLQELELADDGELIHHGQKLDKSAIELAAQALTDNPDHLRAWHRLANAPALTAFLVGGDAQHLASLPRPLTTDPALPALIGPRYAEQFDKALLAAWQADDAATVRALVAAPALYLPAERGRAFRGVSRFVREQIKEVETVTESFDEDDDAGYLLEQVADWTAVAGGDDDSDFSNYEEDDFIYTIGHLASYRVRDFCLYACTNGYWREARPKLLLMLPADVHQQLASDLALAARNFCVKHFNTFSDAAVVIPVIGAAVEIAPDSRTRDKLLAELRQFEEIGERQTERARQEAIAAQFGDILTNLLAYTQQLEKGKISIRAVRQWADGLAADIKRLNALDDDADEPRQMLAGGLRNLSVTIWNEKEDGEAALAVLERALSVRVDSKLTANLKKAKADLTEAVAMQAFQRRVEEKLAQLVELIKQVESKRASKHTIQSYFPDLADTIRWLNACTDKASQARDNLAIALRALAVELWNGSNEGDTAQRVLEYASSVNASSKILREVAKAKVDLTEAMRPKGLFGWVKKLLSAVALLLMASISSCDDSNRHYREASTPAPPPTIADSATYEPPASPYAGNQLTNGASPLDNCFGKGKYSGPAWVSFKNGNGTDAIVCLVDNQTEKTVRNEYIRAGTDFRMTSIPGGTYYLKVFHGRDWNPTRRSACGTAGYFDSGQSFSVSRGAADLLEIHSGGGSYTTGEITLYTVDNGNRVAAKG